MIYPPPGSHTDTIPRDRWDGISRGISHIFPATKENHVKDLARIPGAIIIDLEKNHKEVNRERETDSYSNDF